MLQKEWSASVVIKGAISFSDRFCLNDVELRSRSQDIVATCRVYANSSSNAQDIVIRKISDVLDIISFLSDQHMEIKGAVNLQSTGGGIADLPASFSVRRILNEHDIQEIENYNQTLSDAQTTDYLRALSYYRKGLGSIDPFDKFVSFWQTIEIVINKVSGRGGIRNKAETFFNHIPMLLPPEFEVYREMRNNIVHGSKSRDIDQIRNVSGNIEGIKKLATLVLQKAKENRTLNQIILE